MHDRFCVAAYGRTDSLQVLLEANSQKYISFFEWVYDQSQFEDLSLRSLKAVWALLCLKFAQAAGHKMPEDTQNFMALALNKEGYLAKKLNLRLLPKEKPVLDMDTFL